MDSYNKSEFLSPGKILPYVLLRLPLPAADDDKAPSGRVLSTRGG